MNVVGKFHYLIQSRGDQILLSVPRHSSGAVLVKWKDVYAKRKKHRIGARILLRIDGRAADPAPSRRQLLGTRSPSRFLNVQESLQFQLHVV
jgi:hypothetical protein